MTLEYANHFGLRQHLIFLEVRWTLCSTTYFSDAGSRKHQCPGLFWVAHATTSWTLWKKVSALLFFVHSMSLSIDMNLILSSEDSGFCRSKISQNAS